MPSHPTTAASRWHDGTPFRLILEARNAMLLAIEQELAPLGVSAAQFMVVLAVAEGQGSTASECARLLGYDSGAMSRLLDRIEDKGLLRRRRDTTDRRMVQVALTSKGRALHPLISASVDRVHLRMLQGFSAAELDQFESLLRRLTGAEKERLRERDPDWATTVVRASS